MEVLFWNFAPVFLVWRKLFYFITLEVYKDEGFLLLFSCFSRENMLTSENDAANNPLVSILWPRHRTQNSSSSIFLFFIFPCMHLSKQRFRWLQFEDNLLQLLMAASAAVHAGMGFHSHECKSRSLIDQLKAHQPFEVAKRRSPGEARGIGDKSHIQRGFPGGAVVKNTPTNVGDARDTGSISGSGRSPGEGNGNPLQYSCLGNPMNRGACWATVHGV